MTKKLNTDLRVVFLPSFSEWDYMEGDSTAVAVYALTPFNVTPANPNCTLLKYHFIQYKVPPADAALQSGCNSCVQCCRNYSIKRTQLPMTN